MFQTAQVIDIWIVLVSFSSYQLFLQIRSHGRNRYQEGLPKVLQIITGIPALLVLAAFMFDPDLPTPQPLSLTAGIDIAGLVLFNLAGLLILWSHVSLGDCWSGELETKADHPLVNRGLYRWVRHPLYSSYLILTIGLFLMSDNWRVAAVILIYFLTVASRVEKEEVMMVQTLGTTYLDYQRTTGRFVPKFGTRKIPAQKIAERSGDAAVWDLELTQERERVPTSPTR